MTDEQSQESQALGGPATQPTGTPGPRGVLRIVVQLIGFAAGLALLGWCGREALKPENREQLARLGDAGPGPVSLLLACSFVTLLLNGMIFWTVLRPEKKLSLAGIQATNALAMMLAYLPFKISLFARIGIHNRRDGVPLLTIAAWFGAIGALIIVGLGPVSVVSLARGGVDLWWWVWSAVGIVGGLAALIAVAKALAGEPGLARVHRIAGVLRLAALDRFVRTEAFTRLHAVFGMLAHPAAACWATVFRLADVALLALRFVVAAAVLGVTLEWEHAILFASSYFLIGMLSPFGMLGTREAGSLGIASLLGFADAGESLAVVILLVSATESVASLLAGVAGAAWLRPDRLIRGARAADQAASPPA